MPYILSLEAPNLGEHHFDSVSQAITFYDELLNRGAAPNSDAKLLNPKQGTYVLLHPGITVQTATLELESVWEWAPEDPLKIRPVLKERYWPKP